MGALKKNHPMKSITQETLSGNYKRTMGISTCSCKHLSGDWLLRATAWGSGYRGVWCPKNPSSIDQHLPVGAWSHASEPPHRELLWDYDQIILVMGASQEWTWHPKENIEKKKMRWNPLPSLVSDNIDWNGTRFVSTFNPKGIGELKKSSIQAASFHAWNPHCSWVWPHCKARKLTRARSKKTIFLPLNGQTLIGYHDRTWSY